MTATPEPPRYLQLARVLRPHGIRGAVRVQIITNFPERLARLTQVFIGPASDSYRANREGLKPYHVMRAHHDKANHWLMQFKGVDTREDADKLRDLVLYVAIEEAVPLEENEYYLFQLMGLQVYTTAGQALGKLVEVLETGANDVFVVRGDTYGEVLLPLIDGAITSVDLAAGQLVMHIPDGLLPGDSESDQDDEPDDHDADPHADRADAQPEPDDAP